MDSQQVMERLAVPQGADEVVFARFVDSLGWRYFTYRKSDGHRAAGGPLSDILPGIDDRRTDRAYRADILEAQQRFCPLLDIDFHERLDEDEYDVQAAAWLRLHGGPEATQSRLVRAAPRNFWQGL
ncbi:MAG TPA: hypothetical protein VGO93_31300 [Candidatus Xenobia bacterium]|jgi:hypothetical protein